MKKLLLLVVLLRGVSACASAETLKVGIVGLVHGHVAAFLSGGQMTPAGGILDRSDVQLVGIVEPDEALFDSYARRYHLSPKLRFHSIAEMVRQAHPQAALVFTATGDHRRVVEECAGLGLNVMMEKPLAFRYSDALAIQRAARQGGIHVLVDFETSWYASNAEATRLLQDGSLGPLVKAEVRDGHQGPKEIGVQPEFLQWLTDPQKNGDGALTDFGCYGPDLTTAMLHGEVPVSVTAVTRRLQPQLYPGVDDEADIVLTYKGAVVLVEGSWDWPFAVKQMDVYGRKGYAKAMDPSAVKVRLPQDTVGLVENGPLLAAPYDDPLHYLEAVIDGTVQEGDSLSSLKTNVTVTEILDAARQSAQSGRAIPLPLAQ